jgi:hypothetical protein
VYHTGDYSPGAPGRRATTFEATPILAHDIDCDFQKFVCVFLAGMPSVKSGPFWN